MKVRKEVSLTVETAQIATQMDNFGGIFVINHEESLWRYHPGDQLKFLIGNNNKYTQAAIWNFLEANYNDL